MTNIKIAFGLLFLVVTGLWLLADTLLPETLSYFAFRTPFVQYTGVIGMAMMSVAMILALRPTWLEPRLDGLDKMYRLHEWLAVAYLALVCHSLVLMQYDYLAQPVAWVMAGLMVYGTVAAVQVLAGRLGHHRKVLGKLESAEYYPQLKVIEGNIELGNGWPGLLPVQFAFVSDQSSEAAHPYTVASAWDPAASQLRFIVKQLGDWTGRLPEHLAVGMAVSVEGPYGCFDFNDDCDRQIWIGAGIGMTPFIAKMEHRDQSSNELPVTLFHVTDDYDSTAINKLGAAARAANVHLHVRVTPQEGPLIPEQIREAVPEWQSASLWFCGPASFADAIRKDFINHGMPPQHFHQQLFAMR